MILQQKNIFLVKSSKYWKSFFPLPSCTNCHFFFVFFVFIMLFGILYSMPLWLNHKTRYISYFKKNELKLFGKTWTNILCRIGLDQVCINMEGRTERNWFRLLLHTIKQALSSYIYFQKFVFLNLDAARDNWLYGNRSCTSSKRKN